MLISQGTMSAFAGGQGVIYGCVCVCGCRPGMAVHQALAVHVEKLERRMKTLEVGFEEIHSYLLPLTDGHINMLENIQQTTRDIAGLHIGEQELIDTLKHTGDEVSDLHAKVMETMRSVADMRSALDKMVAKDRALTDAVKGLLNDEHILHERDAVIAHILDSMNQWIKFLDELLRQQGVKNRPSLPPIPQMGAHT